MHYFNVLPLICERNSVRSTKLHMFRNVYVDSVDQALRMSAATHHSDRWTANVT